VKALVDTAVNNLFEQIIEKPDLKARPAVISRCKTAMREGGDRRTVNINQAAFDQTPEMQEAPLELRRRIQIVRDFKVGLTKNRESENLSRNEVEATSDENNTTQLTAGGTYKLSTTKLKAVFSVQAAKLNKGGRSSQAVTKS